MPDAIATALRIAERRTDRNPSDAQKASGNYAKGKMPWHGLSIAIETVKGATRSGMGKNGKRWSVKQPASYGYVLGSEAKDGDHVDVYLGSDHASQKVFVIDQVDADTGKYDEAKAMLSYPSKEAALSDYRKAFSDGRAKERIGGVTEMNIDKFKTWVKSSETKKPMSHGRKTFAAGGRVTAMPMRGFADRGGADWDGSADFADMSGPSTGDLVNSVPRRLAERAMRRSTLKQLSGVDLTPQELSDLAAHGRWTNEVGEPGARNAIAELSGVNSVRRGVDDIGSAWDDGDWLHGLSGGAQIATGLLPYGAMTKGLGPAIGSLYSSPVKAGAVGGALALPTAVSDRAQAQQAKAEAQIVGELQSMSAAQLREHQRMLGIAPDGRIGHETIRATIAHVRAKEAADSPERELRRLGAEGDNAAKIEAAKIKAQAEADALRMREELKLKDERKASDAKAPLRELFSDYMWGLPIVSAVAGGMMGSKIKGKHTSAHEKELQSLSDRTRAALDVGDRPLANALQGRVDALLASGPGGALKSVGSGAVTGGLLGIAPEEIDLARGVPGAWDRATNIPEMAKRFGVGALFGAGPAFEGAIRKGAGSKDAVAGIPNYSAEVGVNPTKSVAARMKHIEDQMKLDRASIRADARTSEAKSVADAARRDAELTRLEAVEARRRSGELVAGSGPGQSQTQRQLPSSELSGNPLLAPTTPAPKMIPGTDTPLAPGWNLNVNNVPYNVHTGHPVPKRHYTAKPDKKQSKDAKKSTEDDAGKAHGGGVGHALGLARKYAAGGRVLTGAIVGKTGGREDALPVDVPEGAFVVPADVVAALGSGNTLAGMHKLEKTFGKSNRPARSSGGAVPIRISDGEFVVAPEHVANLGQGDMNAGHRTLDALVMKLRNQNIKALASLPPPSK